MKALVHSFTKFLTCTYCKPERTLNRSDTKSDLRQANRKRHLLPEHRKDFIRAPGTSLNLHGALNKCNNIHLVLEHHPS